MNSEIVQCWKFTISFFCSQKCPGDNLIKAYAWAKNVRNNSDIIIMSGFHTIVEKDVLDILICGNCSIVYSPARSVDNLRVPNKWRPLIESSRMEIISPFKPYEKRITKKNSVKRNNFIAYLADEILVIYASPGGTLEAQAREWIEAGLNVNWL